MNRKLANRILQIFIAIWISITLAILVVLLCGDACLKENPEYVIQVAISLFCSIWLGVCIFKRTSENKLK